MGVYEFAYARTVHKSQTVGETSYGTGHKDIIHCQQEDLSRPARERRFCVKRDVGPHTGTQ